MIYLYTFALKTEVANKVGLTPLLFLANGMILVFAGTAFFQCAWWLLVSAAAVINSEIGRAHV